MLNGHYNFATLGLIFHLNQLQKKNGEGIIHQQDHAMSNITDSINSQIHVTTRGLTVWNVLQLRTVALKPKDSDDQIQHFLD